MDTNFDFSASQSQGGGDVEEHSQKDQSKRVSFSSFELFKEMCANSIHFERYPYFCNVYNTIFIAVMSRKNVHKVGRHSLEYLCHLCKLYFIHCIVKHGQILVAE